MVHSESISMATERRTQARIDLQISVELAIPGHDKPVRASTRDLSWGGALLYLSEPLPENVETLTLSLPWRTGKTIRALCQMLRERPLSEGGYLVALRFISLSPRGQSRLERLLKMLHPSDTTAGEDGKLALFRELEVTVSDTDELREKLLQILEGRYTVTVFETYQVGQSISLSIRGTFDLPSIRLRARVSDVRKSEVKGFDWAELYTLSLAFEHPSSTIRTFVDLVLNRLSNTEEENSTFSSYLEGAPDWLKSVATATARSSTSHTRSELASEEETRSCLESEFPEAVERLVAGWGNVKDFEMVFKSLVLGRNDLPGGWSQEAWDELEMLQSVHDRAYGVSEQRSSPLKGGRL